jgi:F-type H+-transporting ATPase subunit gamma
MSGATEALGRSIAGARDLKSVVRSMKALAASSIGQYERAVDALGDYYRAVELGLSACLKAAPATSAPGSRPPSDGRIGAIIFGSDQGLVGRFNDLLLEFALGKLGSLRGDVRQVWAVGERMHAMTSEAALPTPALLPVPNSVDTIAPLVGRILIAIEAARERDDIREIYVFHNRPKTAAVYEPVGRRLLPLDAEWQRGIAALSWPTKNLPQVIEGTAPALGAFIREYFFILLFQACAQSLASENASRLAAMQRAEKNIDRILAELNRTFHRIRQEAIDEELFEVISGYESLTAGSHRPPAP